ncbi:MAG: hypothetical protein NTU45_13075 [Planctomycetota bacterium]|nr:hypothetical protein [Planctomycetota bacterium]
MREPAHRIRIASTPIAMPNAADAGETAVGDRLAVAEGQLHHVERDEAEARDAEHVHIALEVAVALETLGESPCEADQHEEVGDPAQARTRVLAAEPKSKQVEGLEEEERQHEEAERPRADSLRSKQEVA